MNILYRLRTLLVGLVASIITLSPAGLHAQYHPDVFSLKKASDLYDERGFQQNAAISVDGNMGVSNSNGNVSYSYPISSHMEGGYPLTVSLNYCGSVAVTAFQKYELATHIVEMPLGGGLGSGSIQGPTDYSSWQRFHQNRPAWIIGVNGFALNVLSSTTHFHTQPASHGFSETATEFTDHDYLWMIDGYDFCNRMWDFNAVGAYSAAGSHYTDQIQILRADGSVLRLLHDTVASSTEPDLRPELYTGYYHEQEGNAAGYGFVEFDSTYLTLQLRELTGRDSAIRVTDATRPGGHFDTTITVSAVNSYALVPRTLHYYPGDGLEYIFREWRAPYGTLPMRDYTLRSGGMFAGPTIFYLEDIRSNAGPVASFTRTRHYPIFGNPLFEDREDSTRGRALITSFPGHQISFGYNSLVIEALGRTTKIKFDTIARSGNTTAIETMPYANIGGITPASLALSTYPETDPRPYKSFFGYVTQIIDPENRVTSFEYEKVSRRYQNFNFPWPNRSDTSADQNITLKNYRLKAVNEPTARYVLKYYSDLSHDITTSTESASDGPQKLNDVVDSVYKYDNDGNRLTTSAYGFTYLNNTDGQSQTSSATQTTVDNVTGLSRMTTYDYGVIPLGTFNVKVPQQRYTYLKKIQQDDGSILSTVTENTYKAGTALGLANCTSNYVILPTETKVTVNGVIKSHQFFAHTLDTLRFYGGDLWRAGRFGMGIARKVTNIARPDLSSNILLRDTVEYLNLRQIDSSMSWLERRWNKFATMSHYLSLKAAHDPAVVGRRWEQVMYSPSVAVIDTVTIDDDVHIPPLFGLERRHVIADSTGIVTGKITAYQTNILSSTLRQLRGQVIADTILGQTGVKLPGNTYKYYGPLLFGKTNANGASEDYGYDFAFCSDLLADIISCSDDRPTGKRLANDNSITNKALELSAYSYNYMKPLAEKHNLRRYDTTTTLRNDSLVTFYERTYYGLVSGTRDPNGWYSRLDYDADGRLNIGWLPYDFPREGMLDTVSYRGRESSELYGITWYNRQSDTNHCERNTSIAGHPMMGTVHHGPVFTTSIDDTLYASLPVADVPDCPNCALEVAQKGNNRQLMVACDLPSSYPYNEQSGFDGFYGDLEYRMESDSPLKLATAIDSVNLELMISSIIGDCIHLEVSIPNPSDATTPWFTQTFALNCSKVELGGGGIGLHAGKGDDRGMLSSSVTTVPGGYRMRVDLSSIKSTLAGRPVNSATHIYLKMKTVGGTVAFVSGGDGEDTRPHLNIYGSYKKLSDRNDYTLNFTHDDNAQTALVSSKVDDINHTANHYALASMYGATIRRDTAKHYFGADGRLLRSENLVLLNNTGATRVDTTFLAYTGAGQKAMITDPVKDSVKMEYDAAGRPIKTINQDGTFSTIRYTLGAPSTFGITDQDFYGHCTAKTVVDENGIMHTQYYDAFDRLRREVIDSGNAAATVPALNLTTRYEYDLFGKPLRVINPKGDTTFYGYDIFNRTAVKFQPDLGAVSYAYDALGNVRFTQSQEQFVKGRLTFNEYDDLNRITLVGEASICDQGAGLSYEDDGPASGWLRGHTFGPTGIPHGSARKGDEEPSLLDEVTINPCGGAFRLTELIDGNTLHTNPSTPVTPVTANPTLWNTPLRAVPTFWTDTTAKSSSCSLSAIDTFLNETSAPVTPLIKHGVQYYAAPANVFASTSEFENVAKYPEFPRMAISYDTLPFRKGAIWKNFPAWKTWDSIAPTGKVRNLKGHEAAIAYREHGGEPYHYTVLSYDERGRVEVLMRFTENLGYDAVYYSYNSMNLVTQIHVVDPLRTYNTYYSYDQNGRVDSVWSILENGGRGLARLLNFKNIGKPGGSFGLPLATPDIVYHYSKTGQIDTMKYPPVDVRVQYAYAHRKWLDSLVAMKGSDTLFRQVLLHDSTGEIMRQISQHYGAGTPIDTQRYRYDAAQRLTSYDRLPGIVSGTPITESYFYDKVGNRDSTLYTDGYYPNARNKYTIGGAAGGANRLAQTKKRDPSNNPIYPGTVTYGYDSNGAVNLKEHTAVGGLPDGKQEFVYSYRGLLRRIGDGNLDWMSTEVRYRYSPGGEREQKRVTSSYASDAVKPYPWVYYLLGGNNQQLAVYHGQQKSNTTCSDTGRRVYMYPFEYLTYGNSAVSNFSTRADGTKEYRIVDHLGSTRVGLTNTAIDARYNYEAFGKQQPVTGVYTPREGYIGKEKDIESQTFDFGVRKYDDETGRFLSVDPLWEKYTGLTLYQYGGNNPVNLTDRSGDSIDYKKWQGTPEAQMTARLTFEFALMQMEGTEAGARLQRIADDPNAVLHFHLVQDGDMKAQDDNFTPDGQDLHWNPNVGLAYLDEDGKEQRLSPLSCLVHEGAAHAYLHFYGSLEEQQTAAEQISNWTTKGEKSAIHNIEFPFAKGRGEVTKPRTGHNGRYIHQVSVWFENIKNRVLHNQSYYPRAVPGETKGK